MCGIVGILDQRQDGRADPDLVRAMSRTIVHRGPDGDGFFHWPESRPQIALGMRRLSIIDLDTGDQPIFNEDRSVAIVFNGEIYNYVELRAELETRGHRFRTQADTETIVHAYEEYDLDLFEHLRGMYAFALWDTRRERLLLAVDHIGIKPLYLAERDGRLLFASEVKALFVDPGLPRRLNLDTLDTFLTFGYMIGPETLYEGVRRLLPGHALVVEGDKSRLVRHWNTHYPIPAGPPDRRAREHSRGARAPDRVRAAAPAQRRAAGPVPERRHRLRDHAGADEPARAGADQDVFRRLRRGPGCRKSRR